MTRGSYQVVFETLMRRAFRMEWGESVLSRGMLLIRQNYIAVSNKRETVDLVETVDGGGKYSYNPTDNCYFKAVCCKMI